MIVLTLICLIFSSCSSTIHQRDSYMVAYRTGQVERAEAISSEAVEKAIKKGRYTKSKEAVWLLLDRALLRFLKEDMSGAIRDFDLALQAADYYRQPLALETMQQLLLQDSARAYAGDHFEQLYATVYMACALLHKGDTSNAFAVLRGGEERLQRLKEELRSFDLTRDWQPPENPLGKLLFAALLEKQGDFSNAQIVYRELARSAPHCRLVPKSLSKDNACVLFLHHRGQVPTKISDTSDASVASAAAVEIILESFGVDPAWSSLTGIPVPRLIQSGPTPRPLLSNQCLLANVSKTAQQTLDEKMPMIVARGVARMVMRRTFVASAKKESEDLGAAADLGMLFANLATRADTRQWSTLPAKIDVVRLDLSPGDYSWPLAGGITASLELKPGDLKLIHLFQPTPEDLIVLVPDGGHS